MKDLVEHIYNGEFVAADSVIEEAMVKKLTAALHASKKKLAARSFTGAPKMMQEKIAKGDDTKEAEYDEKKNKEAEDDCGCMGEEINEARIGIVRARIRGGKVQRRKKVSLVPGMTMRGGKLTRMSAAERRKRKMGARRGKLKARAKRVQMLRKRKLSLMKRQRLGI